ncbi:MAG: hypothetical protein IH989_01385 [Planctomycetes bacterium]|nr:hypothetical protein [Planctomycetota bacterium]
MSTHGLRYWTTLLLAHATTLSAQTNGQRAGDSPPAGDVRRLDSSRTAIGTDQECIVASAAIPDTLGAKNRYLSIVAGDSGRTQAVRVRFIDLPPPFDSGNGMTLWAQGPIHGIEFSNGPFPATRFNAASLGCTPVFTSWGDLVGSCRIQSGNCFSNLHPGGACSTDAECVPAVLHLVHEWIVPGAAYEIQVIDGTCDVNNEAHYSPPLTVTTSRRGDITGGCPTRPCDPPDGNVDIIDVLADIRGFIRLEIVARTDIEPACVDLVVGIPDVLRVIRAFQGLPYPYPPSAMDPCDSTCRQWVRGK